MGLFGRVLTIVARAPMPIIAPHRFAARQTEACCELTESSPLVEACEPRPFTPGVLNGDVVVKD